MTQDTALLNDPDWWRGAVIYQIYPRSFQDDNGDGIGDLVGITRRLPHIASLGADAIWISPFFTSPMKDFGYDVSDYYDVDPMFGTLEDFKALVARAHELGLRVMIDQVLSHSSDQHAWFVESRQSRDNPKSDWYVWADPKPDGNPPNNWLSIFGGSAWQWDPRREQYYLHNFLTSQPDLNFHNADVQQALLDVVRFWLDLGVDGFRLDTINFFVHDDQLRDNPPLALERRSATIAPSVNPYNHQEHLFDKNRPENLAFLARFRALLDEYPGSAAVGEVGDDLRGLEIMGEYTRGNSGVHMCYAFELLCPEQPTAARMAQVFQDVAEKAPEGWPCWAYSNHDVIRHKTRWNLSDVAAQCYTTLQMCLRGSVCIYQGEELGLPEADVAFEDLQDPYGIEFWPEFKGRDGCRTPMVWASNEPNGGFSGAKPWLPMSPDHMALAPDAQHAPDAMLAHYTRAIGLRHEYAALAKGTQTPMQVAGNLLSFERRHDGMRLFCVFNLSDNAAQFDLPAGRWKRVQVGAEAIENETLDGARGLHIASWEALILELVE